jgi:microsomal dipeptidase-like Zn-dependent dipeptidase
MSASRVRAFVLLLLAAVILLALYALAVAPARIERGMNAVLPHEPRTLSPEAAALHADLLVGDLHTDSTLWRRDLTRRSDRGHVDLPRLREGNVALQVFTSVTKSPAGQNYVSNTADARDNITLLAIAQRWPLRTWGSLAERALYQASRLNAIAGEHPGELRILRTAGDLEALLADRAAGAGTLGAVLGIEGAHALEGDLANLDRLFDAGVRMVGLQHFFDNELGGSLHGTSGDGLSPFGRRVVAALDERGVIIDVAHSSEASVRDVLALSSRPLVVSHTGFKGVCDTPRNISDTLMQRIAGRGGLVGVGFWDAAVCDVSAEGIVAALRYGIDLLGEDHVALGSDYDGSTTVPFDISELGVLTQTMLERGFSEREIRKVMGENLRRFLAQNLPRSGA